MDHAAEKAKSKLFCIAGSIGDFRVAKRTGYADVPTQSTLCSFISSVQFFQNNNLTTQDHESIIVVSIFLSKSEDRSVLFDNTSVNSCLCPSKKWQV